MGVAYAMDQSQRVASHQKGEVGRRETTMGARRKLSAARREIRRSGGPHGELRRQGTLRQAFELLKPTPEEIPNGSTR